MWLEGDMFLGAAEALAVGLLSLDNWGVAGADCGLMGGNTAAQFKLKFTDACPMMIFQLYLHKVHGNTDFVLKKRKQPFYSTQDCFIPHGYMSKKYINQRPKQSLTSTLIFELHSDICLHDCYVYLIVHIQFISADG